MLKKILIMLLAATIIGVCTGVYLYNMPPKKVEDMKGITATATALSKEYAENEKAADAKYLNKAIEVSGTINDLDKSGGGLMIILETGDPASGVQCAMRDKDLKLTKGQNVIVKGFCSGKLMDVSLTGCVLK